MAAAASGHTARFVEWHMAAAEALGYQALWLEMEGNITTPAASQRRASEMRL